MAPPPEYDKEPKAPDKSASSTNCEDLKTHSTAHDQQTNSDCKTTNTAANVEPEDKNVETLDDGQLRALLDEAITYKCPKDREGKSSLFKVLLESVEQDEQACEAAARTWGSGAARGGRSVRAAAGRPRRALPHSNSLQDLVAAALAAEPAPRRRHHHRDRDQHQVSARTHHGGSLPSGVDTSFLLSEEPPRGGVEYVATVRCENPTPLAERRVSASDAHHLGSDDARDRRSKMSAFPMTYTARATLEIGSGSVGTGRAVTTTTASNQVRPPTPQHTAPHHPRRRPPTYGPPERMFSVAAQLYDPRKDNRNQRKLLSALKPKSYGGGATSMPLGPDRDSRPVQTPEKGTVITSNKKKNNFQEDTREDGVKQSDKTKKPMAFQITSKPKPAFPSSHVQLKKVDDKTQNRRQVNNKVTHPAICPPVIHSRNDQTPKEEKSPVIKSKKKKKKKNFQEDNREDGVKQSDKTIKPTASQITSKPNPAFLSSHIQLKKVDDKLTAPRDAKNTVTNPAIFQPTCSEYMPLNLIEQPNKKRLPPKETRALKVNAVPNNNTIKAFQSSQSTPRKEYLTKQPQNPSIAQSYFDRKYNNSRNFDTNDGENIMTDTRSCGPPEALFNRNPPKSRLRQRYNSSPVDYEFLEQFCDTSAFQMTEPISLRNNAYGHRYTSNHYLGDDINAPLYTKDKLCDNKVPNRTKKSNSLRYSTHTSSLEFQRYQIYAITEDEVKKDFADDSRINTRNFKLMTIGNPHTAIAVTDNRDSVDDEVNVTDKASKDKNCGNNCKALTAPDSNVTNTDSNCANIQKDDAILHLQENNPENETSTVEGIKKNAPFVEVKNIPKSMKTETVIWAMNDVDPEPTNRLEYVDEVTIDCKVADQAAEDIKSELEDDRFEDIDEFSKFNKEIDNIKSLKWTVDEIDAIDYADEIIGDCKRSGMREPVEEVLSFSQGKIVSSIKPDTDQFKDNLSEFNANFHTEKGIESDINDNEIKESYDISESLGDFKTFVPFETTRFKNDKCLEMTTINVTEPTEQKIKDDTDDCIELVDIPSHSDETEQQDSVKHFPSLKSFYENFESFINPVSDDTVDKEITVFDKIQAGHDPSNQSSEMSNKEPLSVVPADNEDCNRDYKTVTATDNIEDMKLARINRNSLPPISYGEQYVLAELSNNAYIFLTFPKRLLTNNDNNTEKLLSITDKSSEATRESNQNSDQSNRQSLRKMLFEKLLRDGVPSDRLQMPSSADKVDSGIPFSCIPSPEVVTSCNTTSSSQASLPAEQKPRAIVSGYGGLPLSRPANYGATAVSEYKKSLDENGNSVGGASSPQSGSSQNKKARKKKTSKNETVITSDQINGYQGNKDLKEVLRFIESNEEHGRGKLARVHAKHREEDDKHAKKRSADRRRDTKHLPPRASSLDERSRTTLHDLTAAAPAAAHSAAPAAAAPERRSWGDDALYYSEPAPPVAPASVTPAAPAGKKKSKPPPAESEPPAELLDFQTVTKKKKPRKRFDEAAPGAAGAHSPPERRRKSAPPSDKSNDSNDDMDSVHSLPAARPAHPAAPAPPASASYADIARTRNTLNNIPDLIESCNYYVEEPPAPPPPPAAAAPAAPAPRAPAIDADSYPALTARTPRKPAAPPAPAPAPAAPPPPPAAPDVVRGGGGGRGTCARPAVVLAAADGCGGGGELEGVTFGFDVNEQLLAARRCDLVLGADAALRYVPPQPPPDHYRDHLAAIVDYVGHAWEDIVKCGSGGGKVRYFSE